MRAGARTGAGGLQPIGNSQAQLWQARADRALRIVVARARRSLVRWSHQGAVAFAPELPSTEAPAAPYCAPVRKTDCEPLSSSLYLHLLGSSNQTPGTQGNQTIKLMSK